jgi:hypothetical protein
LSGVLTPDGSDLQAASAATRKELLTASREKHTMMGNDALTYGLRADLSALTSRVASLEQRFTQMELTLARLVEAVGNLALPPDELRILLED